MKAGKVCVVVGMLFVANMVHGANPGDVVINEIAWMGTKASSSDEWIELYNNTESPIDISNWSIYGSDTGVNINFSAADGKTTTIIPTHGYLIYASHNDDVKNSSGENIVDIWDATVSMNNTSPGQLILYDQPNGGGNVVDIANQATGNWFAGVASPDYKTMERVNPTASGSNADNWGTNNGTVVNGKDASNNAINGTPKAQNSVFDLSLSVEMSNFYATVEKEAVQIRWQTASEVDTRGFHVSRGLDKDGPFERLTTVPIPAKGNNAFGEAYSYTDYTVEANAEYWYHLEELDAFGQMHSLGKVRVLTSGNEFLPEDHELIGSYPNPFNPQTTIEYRIGETGEEGGVDLSIYNLIGQKVKTLAAGQVTPGHHVEQWFGDDETGNPVSSGMYVLRLSVDGMLVESGKLIKME